MYGVEKIGTSGRKPVISGGIAGFLLLKISKLCVKIRKRFLRFVTHNFDLNFALRLENWKNYFLSSVFAAAECNDE